MLKFSICIAFAIIAISKSARGDDEEETEELKIEVLKKVENCKYRSKIGDTLTWHYTGKLTDGTVFDSSVGRDPYWATLGHGQIIQGVDEGMLDMCVGEIRRLTVPPHMGYGDRGYPGSIPPKATLIFDNELLKIDRGNGGEL